MSQIFLLTKPPSSHRAGLCMAMAGRSPDSRIYLAGDGVYNVLGGGLDLVPLDRVYACREDLEARGIAQRSRVALPENFYEAFITDAMETGDRVYSF